MCFRSMALAELPCFQSYFIQWPRFTISFGKQQSICPRKTVAISFYNIFYIIFSQRLLFLHIKQRNFSCISYILTASGERYIFLGRSIAFLIGFPPISCFLQSPTTFRATQAKHSSLTRTVQSATLLCCFFEKAQNYIRLMKTNSIT